MAWIIFDKIEYQENLKSKAGTPYSAYVLTGTKKGYDGAPDEPYRKVMFETTPTTIIEGEIERPGISMVSFFQNACKQGDTVILKNVRKAKGWEIVSLENLRLSKGASAKPYTPLTEADKVTATYADATRPSTPQMSPLAFTQFDDENTTN